MSKEVKYIHKVGDNTFLFETYEQPLRTQIEELKQQLAEKEKEIEYQESMKILAVKNQNQKAIEQLEKVKEELVKLGQDYSLNLCGIKIYNFVDDQINELKGENK